MATSEILELKIKKKEMKDKLKREYLKTRLIVNLESNGNYMKAIDKWVISLF